MNQADYLKAAALARECVETGAGVDKELIARAAQEMAAAVEEVNKRLRKADAVLRDRNIDEAVRLCDIEPNLLESVEVLDLAEQDMWQQLAESEGFSFGEPLLLGVAGDLNEAYALQQPLAELMKRHRLLAIARAPLADRLAVLRKLYENDPDNISWQEDVEAFEKERHKHIGSDLQAAANSSDLAAAQRIKAELNDTPWILPPDELLASQARGLVKKLVAEVKYQQLAEVAASIEQAYLQKDYDWAVTLRDEWDRLAGTIEVQSHDPIWDTVIPVFDWIDEQALLTQTADEHTKALIKLTRMLNLKNNLTIINQQARKVRKLGKLPVDVARRIEDYRLSIANTRERRKRIAGYSAASILAVTIIAIGWFWLQANFAAAHRREIAKIQELYDNERYQKVVDVSEESSAVVREDSDVERCVRESRKILAGWAVTVQQLKASLAARKKATDDCINSVNTLLAGDNDRPNQFIAENSRIDDVFQANNENHCDAIVNAADGLPVDFANLKQKHDAGIDQLNGQLSDAKDRLSEAANTQFLTNLLKLESRLDGDESAEKDQLIGLRQENAELVDAWNAILNADARSQAQDFTNLLKDSIAAIDRREKYTDDFLSLARSGNDRIRYQTEALDFIDKHLEREESAERRQVLNEDLYAWKALDDFRRVAEEWGKIGSEQSLSYKRQSLKEWHGAASVLLDQYPVLPQRQELVDRIQFIETILNRNKSVDPLFALQRTLSEPVYAEVNYFEGANGQWGYYHEDPVYDGENDVYHFKVIVDREVKEVNADVEDPTKGFAVHCRGIKHGQTLAEDVTKDPYTVRWEDAMWNLINHYAFAEEGFDALVQYEILRELIQVAGNSSATISNVAMDDFDHFNQAIPGSIEWMSPGEGTNAQRREAANEVQRFQRRLPVLIDEERDLRRSMQANRFAPYRSVGVLDQDDQGQWVVRSSGSERIEAEIFIAGPRGAKGLLQSLGNPTPDKNQISANSSVNEMKKGRPVFQQLK